MEPRPWPFPWPSLEDQGIRYRVHGAYLILYRIDGDRVVILLVAHGAREYGRLLSLDD